MTLNLKMKSATIASLLKDAEQRLPGSPTPRLDAEVLLCHVLSAARSHLFSSPDERVPGAKQARYYHFIAERARGMPIAYLIGRREFWSLDIRVNEYTLIPRPETEHLVEVALHLIQTQGIRHLADLGTGSGAIALAIASECPECQIIATDISGDALHVARQNAIRLGFHNISFHQGNWCEGLDGMSFDLIVSNPPYVPVSDPCLEEGDLHFEPPIAFMGGADGLGAVRQIIAQARGYLRPGGWLALEHGYNQRSAVWSLLRSSGFHDLSTSCDYSGNDRVTVARYGKP
jgi:release factor glutamine methyltransferase